MRVVTLCLAVAAVGAAAGVLAPAAGVAADTYSPNVRDCSIQATKGAKISSARGMRCISAAREIQRYRGQISFSFHTPRGYRCQRVSGGQFGGQWRCTQAPRAFRFEFAD